MVSRNNRARQTPHHLSCSDLGRAQNAGPTESLRLLGLPKCLNLSGLDLGSTGSPGPAADGTQRSNLEPVQPGQRGYTRHERGVRPSVAEALRAHASVICLQQPSLPPISVTEQVRL